MKASFSLSIPKPCSEDWNSFTSTSNGGFCGSCQKNVIDFTKATDDEIIAFIIQKHKYTRQKGDAGMACGRFRNDQLRTYAILPEVKIRPGFVLLKAGVIGLLLLLINKPASAQTATISSKTETVQKQQPVAILPVKQKEFVIQGVVTSSEDSLPLPGVSVAQRNTENSTQTDAAGRFEMQIDPSKGNILTFSFIGFKAEDYKLTVDTRDIAIVMEPDYTLLGELVFMGTVSVDDSYSENQHLFRRMWTRLKNIF